MKSNYDIVIFDWDGTIVNSGFSVMSSIRHVLKVNNIPLPSMQECTRFVGPPIRKGLATICGLNQELSDKIAIQYRRYYEENYWSKNFFYPNIPELMRLLFASNAYVAIATSRPYTSAIKVIGSKGFIGKLDYISAPEDKKPNIEKKYLIRRVLEEYKRKNKKSPSSVMMIGDTLYDIKAAGEVGVYSTAVNYGFGTRESIEPYDPTFWADNVGDLKSILFSIF